MRFWLWLMACWPVVAAPPELVLTVIYDNTSVRPDLTADWGFSALVDFRGQRVLFDAGSKPEIFLENLKRLGIEKSSIQKTFISHEHPNHPRVYRVLPAGLVDFLDSFSKTAHSTNPEQLGPGIYSTGEISGFPSEQALVIETSKGIVMVVSCAHPGIARMVQTVEKQRNAGGIRMIVGGLHMYEQTEQQIRPVVAQLQKLNVQSIILGHCTGDRAMRIFHEAYGEHYGATGAGKRIELD